MRYLGGKSKIRKEVSMFLESVRKPEQIYFEPFVGGGWILQEMKGKRIASDGNTALVNMYIALQNGWVPPDDVDLDLYNNLRKAQESLNPLTAFAGVGGSWGGKWFGGYARGEGRNFLKESKINLEKQLPLIRDVGFIQGLFTDHAPKDMLVYCDPPYADTTQYGAFDGFDTELFWERMREWVKDGNTVVVSEYKAPDDWVCVKEMQSRMGLSTTSDNGAEAKVKRSEKLFMHNSQVIK